MATVVDIFEINVQPIAEQLSALGAQIDSAKKKYAELKQTQGEYAESTIKAKADVNALTKEYKSIETVINNNTKALYALDKTAEESLKTRKFEANSIDTNRKLYNSLYNELIRQKKPTEDQINLVKQLSDALKKQESALGDNRRNVGNYAEGFKSAFGAITQAVPALKGFETAQSGVNAVMSANPIGGLITLFFALKEIVGGNAVVADQLTFAFDAINKAFSFVIDTVVDTVSSLDKLTTAISHPIDFLSKLGSGALQAGKDGYEASKQLDVLTESIGESSVAIEKNNVLIENQKTILGAKKRSDAERLAAAKEIIRLEKENASSREKIAKDELSAETLKLKNTTKSAEQNQKLLLLEAKVEKERADGIASIRKAEIETYKILYGDKEELDKKANEARQKRLEDLKRIEEQHLKDVQSLNDEFNLSEREKLNKKYQDKIDILNSDNEKELALQIKINNERNEALAKFDEEARKKIEAQRKKNADTEKAINDQKFNDQIEQNKRSLDLELESVDLSVGTEQEKANRKRDIQLKYLEEQLALTREYFGADGVITQAELDGIQKIKNAIAKARQGVQKKDEKATFGSSIGLSEEDISEVQQGLQTVQTAVNAIGAVLSASTEVRLNEIEAEKNAEIQAVQESTLSKEKKEEKIRAIEKKYAMEKYEAEKKAFETNKALQIVNAVIAGALGVVSAFQLGPIAGAIAAVAIAATTAAQIAVIASSKMPPPPKFAKGVIGLDGAGNGTSDSIDAKLSRGESVMTAKATERFAPMLAQMELAVGNKPNFQLGKHKFATGYIPTSDGGFYARSASASMLTNSELVKGFESAVKKMPSPTLNYNEFSQFTNSVENSVAISEL